MESVVLFAYQHYSGRSRVKICSVFKMLEIQLENKINLTSLMSFTTFTLCLGIVEAFLFQGRFCLLFYKLVLQSLCDLTVIEESCSS